MELPEQHHEAVTKLLEDGSFNINQIANLFNTTADVIEDFKYRLLSAKTEDEQVEEEQVEEEVNEPEEESTGLTTEDFANLMEHLGGVLTETANLIRKVSRS